MGDDERIRSEIELVETELRVRDTTAAAHREDRALRLMNDCRADWPLWPATSAAAEELGPLIDPPLTARLHRWARTFNNHFHHLDGWDDPVVAAEHRAEAERLLAALRETLPPPWTVSLDYWETTGDGH
ncbi:hypothetical protein ACFVSK_04875 [Cellulosimicrobium cellulans]|uniref:hypothetical protein n=1 Tax=Cellulosimicrobium cellulans TaxID=1710 RepID=UPI0036EFC14B